MSESSLGRSPLSQSGCDDALLWRLKSGGARRRRWSDSDPVQISLLALRFFSWREIVAIRSLRSTWSPSSGLRLYVPFNSLTPAGFFCSPVEAFWIFFIKVLLMNMNFSVNISMLFGVFLFWPKLQHTFWDRPALRSSEGLHIPVLIWESSVKTVS